MHVPHLARREPTEAQRDIPLAPIPTRPFSPDVSGVDISARPYLGPSFHSRDWLALILDTSFLSSSLLSNHHLMDIVAVRERSAVHPNPIYLHTVRLR